MRLDGLPAFAADRAQHMMDIFPAATPTIEEAYPGVYVLHLREGTEEVATVTLWPELRQERSHDLPY